jgi:hypothetical protein
MAVSLSSYWGTFEIIDAPDEKSTIPTTYSPITMITTINKIEIKRGILNLSRILTRGYITKASKTAITKGKMTVAASFSTAPIKTQHISSKSEKMARPE